MFHFICAMKCEARPILDRLRLQPYDGAKLFPVYLDAERGASLTITGTGKLAAAAGTMYAMTLLGAGRCDAWLNVGIAGHKDYQIGQALLVNRIEDVAAGMTWYPQIIFDSGLPSAGMQTLDKASSHYNHDLYELEGAGFYASAIRAGTSELIHCLKIVSDNQSSPVDKITEKMVTGLISDNIDPIMAVHQQLSRLADEIESSANQSPFYDEFLKRWHFTQYQKGTLRQLLNRWRVLKPEDNPLNTELRHSRDAKSLLVALQRTLDAVPIRFGRHRE